MIGTKVVREDGVTKWEGEVTDAPVDFLSNLPQQALPITISGTNNVTFTLNCSTTNPRWLFNGRNFTKIDRAIVYTWGAVSNSILDSTGAQTTDVDSVLGVWYAYLDADMNAIWMSQTAPSYVEAPYCAGLLGHPGTSRNQFYRYIGIMVCTTAATPAFKAMIKVGFWYKFAPTTFTVITDAWTAPTNPTNHIPRLSKYGAECKITLNTGADGQIFVGSHTASTIWDAELDASEGTASNVAAQIIEAPTTITTNDSATPFYAIAAPAGSIDLIGWKDVV